MAAFWWMVHKDLVSEFRSRRVWPAMLLLGVVVALLFSIQMDLLPEHKRQIVGGLLWLSVFFAGATVFERSFAAEREEGCWDALQLLPVSPGTVFFAKLTVNVVALAVLEILLIPLFFVLSGLPVLPHVHQLALIALLASPGLAAVGTLVSALAAGGGKSGSLLVLVVLPLAVPVMLAAAEGTRLALEHRIDDAWWRWIQLLGASSVVFVTAGALLFEYAIED
jgi:heme exporter protein B